MQSLGDLERTVKSGLMRHRVYCEYALSDIIQLVHDTNLQPSIGSNKRLHNSQNVSVFIIAKNTASAEPI